MENSKKDSNDSRIVILDQSDDTQPCPQCNYPIGVLAGSNDAICKNCGFKDPCCE